MSRAPVVAGRFYPGDPGQLKSEVAGYMPEEGMARRQALAVVLPHAGYVYSGPTAGATLARVAVPVMVAVCATAKKGTKTLA